MTLSFGTTLASLARAEWWLSLRQDLFYSIPHSRDSLFYFGLLLYIKMICDAYDHLIILFNHLILLIHCHVYGQLLSKFSDKYLIKLSRESH